MPTIVSTTLPKLVPSSTVTMTALNGQSGNEPATWRNVAAATYELGESLTLSVRQSSAKNNRVICRLRVPLSDAATPSVVKDIATCEISITMPRTSSLADRQNVRSYLNSIMGLTSMQQAIENLAPTT